MITNHHTDHTANHQQDADAEANGKRQRLKSNRGDQSANSAEDGGNGKDEEENHHFIYLYFVRLITYPLHYLLYSLLLKSQYFFEKRPVAKWTKFQTSGQ